jgi:hypothetical protein
MLELQHIGMQRLAGKAVDDLLGGIGQEVGLGLEAGAP